MKPTLVIYNRSRYHNEEVSVLMAVAMDTIIETWPINLKQVTVRVTNTSSRWRGRAYTNGAGRFHDGAQVIVRIGSPERFATPQRISYDFKWNDMPEFFLNSYRECMVYIAAHEFGHTAGKGGRKGGEFYCELAGHDAVIHYRKNQAEIDARIEKLIQQRSERDAARTEKIVKLKAEKNSPECKIEKRLEQLAAWQSKKRRAENAIKKLNRSIGALRRSISRNQEKAAR